MEETSIVVVVAQGYDRLPVATLVLKIRSITRGTIESRVIAVWKAMSLAAFFSFEDSHMMQIAIWPPNWDDH